MPRMKGHITQSSVTFFLGIAAVLLCVASSTPLDDYVKAPDDHFNYTLLSRLHRDNYTLHIINMTSQKWMDNTFSNHPIWWHYVVIIVPKQIKVNDTALLLISDRHNDNKVPDERDLFVGLMAMVAVSTQSVIVVLNQIPNQPIVFMSDPTRRLRTEDKLLSWSWREFMLNPKQPQALVHLAMTKAVVRAMDTVDAYSKDTRHQEINKFLIAGASKRGWTTWLTAAVDSRVIGMAPIEFDLLYMGKCLRHHYRSLGGWSFAFQPYFEANVTSQFGSEPFRKSAEIIDPIVYKDRYKMPTYIIKSTGDEFFMPDETRFYYNKLTGPRHLRVLPNCEHTMIDQVTNTMLGVRSFYLSLLHGSAYPKVDWTMTSSNSTGKIHLTMNMKPLSVIVYYANTLLDGRRDFRLLRWNPTTRDKFVHPVIWFKGQATKLTPTEYEASFKKPQSGWVGFFIEVTFKGVEDSVLAFSTEVNVVPDTLPFPDCTPNCTGRLV